MQNSEVRKWVLWLFLGIIVIVIIAQNHSKNVAKKVGETTAIQSTSQTNEFKIGDVISFDEKVISVLAIKRNCNVGQYRKPKSGNEFIKIAVKIQNSSDSDISIFGYNFKVQDGDGVLRSHEWLFDEDDNFESTTLAPGGKITGILCFEVPKGDQNLKLVYKPSFFFSGKKITIKL